jgi:hypothetical protein
MQNVGHLTQRDEMELHILTSRQVPLASAVFVGDPGELPHLAGGQQSPRNFGPDHLNPGLALAVDAPSKPMGAQLVVRNLTR